MASRVSSVSSISSISSVERRTVDSGSFRHTHVTDSKPDNEQLRIQEKSATDPVNVTVTEEPLLSRRESSHAEEQSADHETKAPIQTNQIHYGTRSWYYDWWFWEIAGAILSLGSTVAIVVMLAVCNNQPMPVLRHGITLNAILSVLSTVAKVSCWRHACDLPKKKYTDV